MNQNNQNEKFISVRPTRYLVLVSVFVCLFGILAIQLFKDGYDWIDKPKMPIYFNAASIFLICIYLYLEIRYLRYKIFKLNKKRILHFFISISLFLGTIAISTIISFFYWDIVTKFSIKIFVIIDLAITALLFLIAIIYFRVNYFFIAKEIYLKEVWVEKKEEPKKETKDFGPSSGIKNA